MDVEAHQNLHSEQTSDCRSFGSKAPSSQSRKISMGVMVDSVANIRYAAIKENGVNMPTDRIISNVEHFTGGKSKVEGMMASFSMKQISQEELKCSRITKSFYQRTPNSETILQANQTSNLLVSTRRQEKAGGIECTPAKYSSVELLSNKTSIIHSSGFKQMKHGEITGKRKIRKEGTTARVENEFTFTTAQGVFKSDKAKPEDIRNKTEKSTENLKIKLWEILATTCPKTRHLGSQTRNMDVKSVLPEQRFDQEDDKFVQTRQNSDTIETDSENPDLRSKRPVTRLWSRKRASVKMQRTKNRSGPSSREKKEHKGKDVFCFEEEWTGRQNIFLDGGSSMFLSKKSQRKNSRKIRFYENDTADKLCRQTSETNMLPCDGETFSFGKKLGGFHGCLPDHHKEYSQTPKIIQEKELYQSSTINKTDEHGEREGLENRNQRDDRSNLVAEHVADPLDNFQSISFGLNRPTISSSPGSTPKTDVKVNGVNSTTLMERTFSPGIIRNLRTFQILAPDCNRQMTLKQSPVSILLKDVDELDISLPREATSFGKNKEALDGLSDSSSEGRTSQGSQEGLRNRQTDEQDTFVLNSIKRLRGHEGIKFYDSTPPLMSSKGAGESDWIPEASEQAQDGLVRVVELLALALGKLKSKLESVSRKKSSEILMSVAQEIHLQLQNVHSQIQEDIGKLTSLSESKRRRLETRFEDQQKQLKLIHEKFKEEINQHIEVCKGAIEGLEAEQIEIKGGLEKRRAWHRKLLSQVEEEVEIQLNDAQRKITAIQELGRRKMLQLKHIISMCLKDGILS